MAKLPKIPKGLPKGTDTHPVTVHLSKREWDDIQHLAAFSGRPVTKYIRRLLADAVVEKTIYRSEKTGKYIWFPINFGKGIKEDGTYDDTYFPDYLGDEELIEDIEEYNAPAIERAKQFKFKSSIAQTNKE